MVVPATLSAGLYALYLRMSTIQNKQADLQERQTNIMDSEQRPVIEVHRITAEGDTVTLELDNIGNGIARNLGVVFHVVCYNSDTEERAYLSPPNSRNQLKNERGSIADLPPAREDLAELSTNVHVQSNLNPGLDRRLSPAIAERLDDSKTDFDQIYYQIEIVFDHLMSSSSQSGSKFLLPARVPINGQIDAEKLIENRNPVRGNFSTYTESEEYGFEPRGDDID